MKKIISTVLCLVLALSLASCGAKTAGRFGTSAAADAELWTITGRYCETTNGQSLILSKKEGAICISPATEEEDLFAGLENGDEIEITVDGVAETYPAQATVYDCTLIQKGSVADLDLDELQALVYMGWEFPFIVGNTD